MTAITEAKEALDTVINRSRVHLYKPIQIAEILYHIRIGDNIDPINLDDYRTKSKLWRDEVCLPLLGRKCTSSAKFQDDLFNAIPPEKIKVLSDENIRTNGGVENYVYSRFNSRHAQLSNALNYCTSSTKDNFDLKIFIDSFWKESGLRRSLDKIYEIIVYALFSTLVDVLNLKVSISVNKDKIDILRYYSDFADKVMGLSVNHLESVQSAHVYRVGVTNAADRGLDMYANWGPAIQIKHLSLTLPLAENIITSISSDKVIIVCKDVEKDVIHSLLHQIGWEERIQSIVTEEDLILWYEKALRGQYKDMMGDELIHRLGEEISLEFPSVASFPDILKNRHYEDTVIKDQLWDYHV